MDPNVQVAAIGVFATLITTMGLVAVAIINNRKEREKAASAGVDSGLDERSVLGLIYSLMTENEEKDEMIEDLKAHNARLVSENRALRSATTGERGMLS